MRRLVLVRHARTAAVRAAGFPTDDEPLDAAGVAAARAGAAAVAAAGWARDGALRSPLPRAGETAALLGLPDARPVAALAEADFGRWAGRTLAEVAAGDPDAVTAWMTDPAAAPHGGESLADVVARVGAWLDSRAAPDGPEGRMLAVTHGGVVKAALVHALGAPLDAFWRLDVAPLGVTELHAHDGRWTVAGVNRPLVAAPAPAADAAVTPDRRGREPRALGAVWGGR